MELNGQRLVLMTETQLKQLMEDAAEKAILGMVKKAHKLNDDCLLSVNEACDFLRITRCTLHKWRKEGIVKPHKKGGRLLYKKSDLLKQAVS